jgi:hypothetical protein
VSSALPSFCIMSSYHFAKTLHHTSYRINNTKIGYEANLWQITLSKWKHVES